MPVIQVFYYTDPVCPWSWALEPAMRKLDSVFGERLRITYVMSGMARDFTDPQAMVAEALEAGARSGMPFDPRLWFEGPPRSSYPACIAVKAAAEQGDPSAYLRRLREGLQCRRRKLDGAEALVDQARAVAGLDIERFRIDLSSNAILESFGADLELAKAAGERGQAGGDRVRLPSLEFRAPDGALHGIYGFTGYEQLHDAARAAGAEPSETHNPPAIEQALRRFGAMATVEVAAVCDLPGPRAPAELWRLASEWRLRNERLGSGELWSLA